MISSIAVINQAPSLSNTDLAKITAAVNKQVQQDFTPIWQKYATVWPFTGDVATLGADTWRVYVKDVPDPSDPADALGYHDIVQGTIIPTGRVFKALTESNKEPWSTVLSHEVLEILADEWINLYVLYGNGDAEQLWPREACDAVQGDWYDIDSVQVSNFVTPAYFVDGAKGPYDKLGLVTKPFEIRPAGYTAYLELNGAMINQKTVYGDLYPEWRKPVRQLSRRDYRTQAIGA